MDVLVTEIERHEGLWVGDDDQVQVRVQAAGVRVKALSSCTVCESAPYQRQYERSRPSVTRPSR